MTNRDLSELLRFNGRKYPDIIDDACQLRGFKYTDLANEVNRLATALGMDLRVDFKLISDWLRRPRDGATSFSKLIELALDINIPPQCYYNVGKR